MTEWRPTDWIHLVTAALGNGGVLTIAALMARKNRKGVRGNSSGIGKLESLCEKQQKEIDALRKKETKLEKRTVVKK